MKARGSTLERRGVAACAAMTFALLACAPVLTPAPASDLEAATPGRLEAMDVAPLAVLTADGERHEFRVYVARSPGEKRDGLMFVESLPDDRGMLFLYAPARPVAMWMKNTPLSLDMLFVRADGRIERIAAGTEPMSEQRYTSDSAITGVIELNAGTAAALGIRPGDRVIHPWFAQR